MCPSMQRLQILFALLAIAAAFVYWRLFQAIAENFAALSVLLTGAERRTTFFSSCLEGLYKGRKVTLAYPHFDKGPNRIFSIEPRAIPVPQGAFLFSYPRPTPNTKWKGDKVVYSSGGFFVRAGDSHFNVYGAEELRLILEELTEAAIKVESGSVAG
jgi:hypothetical protein